MRKRKHRPTKGMTGNYNPLPDIIDSRYLLDRESQNRHRLADLEVLREHRVLENLLDHPKYGRPERETERRALADAANAVRSSRELCAECAMPIRWASDLVDQDRMERLRALDGIAADLRASADRHGRLPDGCADPDHPDAAAASFLAHLSHSLKESDYCVCSELRARLGTEDGFDGP